MKEYTILAFASAFAVAIVDHVLHVRLLVRKEFWIFSMVMFCFTLIANGYLTSRPIVLYGEQFFMSVRLWTIPVEDFFYGFSLVTLTIVLWEYFKRKESDEAEERQ